MQTPHCSLDPKDKPFCWFFLLIPKSGPRYNLVSIWFFLFKKSFIMNYDVNLFLGPITWDSSQCHLWRYWTVPVWMWLCGVKHTGSPQVSFWFILAFQIFPWFREILSVNAWPMWALHVANSFFQARISRTSENCPRPIPFTNRSCYRNKCEKQRVLSK